MRSYDHMNPELDLSGLGVVVVCPEDVRKLRNAEAALEDAKSKADALRRQAKERHSATLAEARNHGFAAGLSDGKAQIADQQRALRRLQTQREQDAMDLAFAILDKLFGDSEPRTNLASCLHKALADTPDAKVIIRPEDHDILLEVLPDGVEVIFDTSLAENTAQLSSELGTITVSLDRQLELIKEMLMAQVATP